MLLRKGYHAGVLGGSSSRAGMRYHGRVWMRVAGLGKEEAWGRRAGRGSGPAHVGPRVCGPSFRRGIGARGRVPEETRPGMIDGAALKPVGWHEDGGGPSSHIDVSTALSSGQWSQKSPGCRSGLVLLERRTRPPAGKERPASRLLAAVARAGKPSAGLRAGLEGSPIRQHWHERPQRAAQAAQHRAISRSHNRKCWLTSAAEFMSLWNKADAAHPRSLEQHLQPSSNTPRRTASNLHIPS